MNLPGEEFAKEHGYTLWSHDSVQKNADYVKSIDPTLPVHLSINSAGEGTLTRVVGMAICKIGPFSIPNKNFHIFEKQIHEVQAIGQTLDDKKHLAVTFLRSLGFFVFTGEEWFQYQNEEKRNDLNN
jgi:hypothetical protein